MSNPAEFLWVGTAAIVFALGMMLFAPQVAFPWLKDPNAGLWNTGALILCLVVGVGVALAGGHVVRETIVVTDKAASLKGNQHWIVWDEQGRQFSISPDSWKATRAGDTVHCDQRTVPVVGVHVGPCV